MVTYSENSALTRIVAESADAPLVQFRNLTGYQADMLRILDGATGPRIEDIDAAFDDVDLSDAEVAQLMAFRAQRAP